jgi:cellulose synthase/poly-beta-1,6-N-acetylglucosamine synthase-like glycosyltransferase
MTGIIGIVLLVLAGLLTIPVTVFVVEIIAALVPNDRRSTGGPENSRRHNVGVLVPAHNESLGLQPTLEDIKRQLQHDDRLLVVADNCTDDTAAIAKAAGAEVIERDQPTQVGKGFALAFGIKHFERDPPAILIFIDADCRLAERAIAQLALTCAITQRPVQALYLMAAPNGSSVNYRVAEFAWRVKNWVRPLGLRVLQLPCQLMGTGMAFPWTVIRSTNLATGSIVEDLKLGLELAEQGAAPLFCPSAVVMSQFPMSAEGAENQRKRWEAGHTEMIYLKFLPCIYAAVTQRNLGLLALTLDLAVPPLSLLMIFLALEFLLAGLAALFSVHSAALIISAACLGGVITAVFLSWLKWGRDVLPAKAILSVAPYFFSKFPLYHRILSRNTSQQWIRTDRKKTD